MWANGWTHGVVMEETKNNHSELQVHLFQYQNSANTTHQGEKKHNWYSLYNICCRTASAVLPEGHCAIFRFCHVLPPLGSCTRIRLGFDCQPSHALSVGAWASHLASLGLRRGFSRWLGVVLTFLIWNSVIGLSQCMTGLLLLGVDWGEGRREIQMRCFPSKPIAAFKIPLTNVTWQGSD